jgi:MFS family permease
MPIVFVTMLIDFAGYTLLVPLLPKFAKELDATPFEVGLIVTVYALTQLIFLPVWGWASDRLGRRPAILGSLFGTTVAYGILIYAVYANSMWWVYFSRVLAGFFASSLGTAQAVVTDLTPPSQRARGMGVLGAAMGIGFVIGPALGGILGQDDVRIPFAFVMAVSFFNFTAALFVLPESRPGDRAPWRRAELARLLVPTPFKVMLASHGRRIGVYLYLFFHLFTAFAALESMFALFLLDRFDADARAAGFVFAWIGIWMALTQGWLLGRMTPAFGEWNLSVGGLTVMALGLAVLPFVQSLDGVYALAPVVAIGNGLSFPSLASLYSKACAADNAGELLGQSQSMATTGRIVGPMWAGYTMGNLGGWLEPRLPAGTHVAGLDLATFSLGACFLIAGILTLLAAAILVLARRTLAPDASAESAPSAPPAPDETPG